MNDVLYAEATLGRDAEEFLKTDIGRFIIGRCDQEIDEARSEMETVPIRKHKRIEHLQNRIWRAKSVKGWITELVIRGREAETQLESEEYQLRDNQ